MYMFASSSKAMALAATASVGALGAGLLVKYDRPRERAVVVPSSSACCCGVAVARPSGRYLGALRAGFGRIALSESSSAVAVRATAEAATTSEPGTKIEFPKLVKLPGASKDLSLLGVGFREKTIAFINVKVYAVGFYVDSEALATAKKGVEDLAQGAFEKGLQIVLARNINGSLFSYALDEEMKPRMKARPAARPPAGYVTANHQDVDDQPPPEQVLAEFGSVFKERNLSKGTIITFAWSPSSSTLHVGISSDGSVPLPVASFQSQALASALFDVYLGDHNPVSPSLKTSVCEGLQLAV